MEASEAIRRIFWRHRWLLIALIIVPVAVIVPLREHQQVTFAAAARIQGQGTTPDASTQVEAIQSRVTAVAADPALVQSAITRAGVNRDASQVAQHDIAVTPLGNSAVMVLTVTDTSRSVAVRLAASLSGIVVNQLNQLGIKDDPELSALNQASLQLSAKRDKLVAQLNAATNAGNKPSTSVQAQSLLAQLSSVEQQLSTNQSTAQQLLATLSANTGASVISVPTSATGVSHHVASDGILAALLGLVVGLLIATVREVVRPTIAQPGAGARELGAVVLGNAEASGDQLTGLDEDLAARLDLAAHRAGVRAVVLTGPGPRARLRALAELLNDELAASEPERAWEGNAWPRPPMSSLSDHIHGSDDCPSGPPGRTVSLRTGRAAGPGPASPLRTAVVALPDINLGAQPVDAALVVVLPAFASHDALDRAADLGVTANWPILGVIGLRRRQRGAPRPAQPQVRTRDAVPDDPDAESRDTIPHGAAT